MKDMLKDAAILFVITLISGALLGLVYQVTKEPIAQQEEKAKTEACKEVFAQADSFAAVTDAAFSPEKLTAYVQEKGFSVDVDEVVSALGADGSFLGYVITVTDHEGYGGDIRFAVGITAQGVLNGISILSISETAGLGMRAEEVLAPQFADKQATQFTYVKTGATAEDQIDAISGATITTNAVTNGVNAALIVNNDCLYSTATIVD